ncbi:hypothetical protein SERLA73DRAFT_127160 [Serpula lacrymans var. lacrymans S7.3]|uniref:Uncharacterized protein n=1 Tax=Serpula lacrymans var. lacrymans (strain S7.3) TaxID=936435 RepID=F8QFQ2_SERL3|nr:hypothetical protein SERLA73DRAFT_127160 [Serpula lacrymans var. lacrymans S7.3]
MNLLQFDQQRNKTNRDNANGYCAWLYTSFRNTMCWLTPPSYLIHIMALASNGLLAR